MKKYISIFILLIFVFGTLCAEAKTQITDECTSLSGWTVTKQNASDPTVDDGIKLSLSGSWLAYSSIEKQIPFDGDVFSASVTFSVNIESSYLSSCNMLMTLSDGTNKANVLYFKNGILYTLTDDNNYKLADALESEEEYTALFAVDTSSQNKKAVIWLKSTSGNYIKVFEGDISDKWSLSRYQNLSVILKNETVGFDTPTSDFIIKNVAVYNGAKSEDIKYYPNSQSGILTPQNLEAITFDFGGRVAPVMYEKENYFLTENGDVKDFDLTSTETGVKVVPENGFSSGKAYKLSAVSKKDILNNDMTVNDIVFTMASADYKVPEVELSSSHSKLYTGNTTEITTNVISDMEIAKVVYTVKYSGEEETFEKTDSEDGYKLSLSKTAAGLYEIKAYAVDIAGGRSLEKSVNVEFVENTAPSVSIANITSGTIDEDDLPEKIILTATDNEKLENVELYIDNALVKTFTQPPYEYETKDISAGNHTIKAVAYDDGGLSDEDIKNILIMPKEGDPALIFEQNFDNYAGGKPADTNFSWWQFDNAEVMSADTSREDTDGKAFLIDYENIAGANQQSFIVFSKTQNAYNKLLVEYDVNIKDLGDMTHYVKIGPTSPHSRGYSLVSFDNREMTYYKNNSANGTYAYPKNEWLSLSFEIDYLKKEFSFKMKNEQGAILTQATNQFNSSVEYAQFCLYFPTQAGQKFKVAFDNFVASSIDAVPVISKIGQDGNVDASVTPTAQNIAVKLTSALKAESVTKENVKLMLGNEEVMVKEISYASMIITIVPDEKLRSDEEYTVVIKETTQTPMESVIGTQVKGRFTTTVGELDLASNTLETQTDKMRVKGELVYTADEPTYAYIILTVWDGDKLSDITIKEMSVSKTNKSFTTDYVEYKNGYKAELYVWDSLSTPNSLTTKIYRY